MARSVTRFPAVILALALALAQVSCGGDDTAAPTGGSGGGGTSVIGAGGGTVTSSDGRVSVTFPPNALSGSSNVSLQTADPDTLGAPYDTLNGSFTLLLHSDVIPTLPLGVRVMDAGSAPAPFLVAQEDTVEFIPSVVLYDSAGTTLALSDHTAYLDMTTGDSYIEGSIPPSAFGPPDASAATTSPPLPRGTIVVVDWQGQVRVTASYVPHTLEVTKTFNALITVGNLNPNTSIEASYSDGTYNRPSQTLIYLGQGLVDLGSVPIGGTIEYITASYECVDECTAQTCFNPSACKSYNGAIQWKLGNDPGVNGWVSFGRCVVCTRYTTSRFFFLLVTDEFNADVYSQKVSVDKDASPQVTATPAPGSPVNTGQAGAQDIANVGGTQIVNNRGSASFSGFKTDANGTMTEVPGSPKTPQGLQFPTGMAVLNNSYHLITGSTATDFLNFWNINDLDGSFAEGANSPYAVDVSIKDFAVTPDDKYLYGMSADAGDVYGFGLTLDPEVGLSLINNGQAYPATGDQVFGAAVNPSGEQLYVATAGQLGFGNGIDVFDVNAATGELTHNEFEFVPQRPFDVIVSLEGDWLIVTFPFAGEVRTFAIDKLTGKLSPGKTVTPGGRPYNMALSDDGNTLFATNGTLGATHVFLFDSATGEPIEGTGSPIPTGTAPFGLTVLPAPQ